MKVLAVLIGILMAGLVTAAVILLNAAYLRRRLIIAREHLPGAHVHRVFLEGSNRLLVIENDTVSLRDLHNRVRHTWPAGQVRAVYPAPARWVLRYPGVGMDITDDKSTKTLRFMVSRRGRPSALAADEVIRDLTVMLATH